MSTDAQVGVYTPGGLAHLNQKPRRLNSCGRCGMLTSVCTSALAATRPAIHPNFNRSAGRVTLFLYVV